MKAIGKENIWFSFNGISNDSMGVHMLSMPTRPHPARKGKVIDIPGTDGDLWQDYGGYKRIIIPIRLITQDNANIDDVNAWLSDEGDLIFGDEPNRAYHARISKEFSRSNRSPRLRGQEFTVSFDCEPHRYEADAGANVLEAVNEAWRNTPTSMFYEDGGTVESLPLIKVENTNGGCWIEVFDRQLQVNYSENPIFIDCAAKYAYSVFDGAKQSAAKYVSGDWLKLPAKAGSIAVTAFNNDSDSDNGTGSNTATVTVTPRYRWL